MTWKNIFKGIIAIILMVYIGYSFIHSDGLCSEGKIFYINSIRGKVSIIDIDTLQYKGINFYYYFNNQKTVFLYKNSIHLHQDYPEILIGDSISKEKNTEDFTLYRNGVIIYEGTNLPCNCKYCN